MWRRTSFIAAIGAFVLVMILWQIPELSGVLYPFRLFVTTVHELGHGLSALLTGGQFLEYTVDASGAGLATYAGGTRLIIVQAGYLGAALFGAILLFLTNRTPYVKFIAIALGIGFAITTVQFAGNGVALLAGLATAAVLILVGWKARPTIATFLLNLLAIITGLNAVLDVVGLFNALNTGRIAGGNDAQTMATLSGIAAPFWAFLWIIVALVFLLIAAYFAFWRPLRKGQI